MGGGNYSNNTAFARLLINVGLRTCNEVFDPLSMLITKGVLVCLKQIAIFSMGNVFYFLGLAFRSVCISLRAS